MPTTKITLPTEIDLDQFISVQAHDLRTPFNHIIGFSKMTINTAGQEPLSDLQKEDLWTIYRSGQRALTMLNGLIDAARLKRGEKELHSTENDIRQLVEQSLAQWAKSNPQSEVQANFHIGATSTTMNTDGVILKQIIASFVAYVALFCEGKTQVLVAVEEEPGWFTFTFTSTGKKVQQASQLDLELFGYVNRAFVELQKGEIRQAEENDEGAIIEFSLPK